MRQFHEAFQDYHKELLSYAIKEKWAEYGLLEELQFDSSSHRSAEVTHWQLALVCTPGPKAYQLPHSGRVEPLVCASLSRWWGCQSRCWTWTWETTAKFWTQLTQLWSLTLCRFCIIPMVSSCTHMEEKPAPEEKEVALLEGLAKLHCWGVQDMFLRLQT